MFFRRALQKINKTRGSFLIESRASLRPLQSEAKQYTSHTHEKLNPYRLGIFSLSTLFVAGAFLNTEGNASTNNTKTRFLKQLDIHRVTIYVWKSHILRGQVGHVSVKTYSGGIDGTGIYASFWPRDGNLFKDTPHLSDSLEADMRNEGALVDRLIPPDETIDLYSLDIEKINQAFMLFENSGCKWDIFGSSLFRTNKARNCSGLAHYLLKEGGIDTITPIHSRNLKNSVYHSLAITKGIVAQIAYFSAASAAHLAYVAVMLEISRRMNNPSLPIMSFEEFGKSYLENPPDGVREETAKLVESAKELLQTMGKLGANILVTTPSDVLEIAQEAEKNEINQLIETSRAEARKLFQVQSDYLGSCINYLSLQITKQHSVISQFLQELKECDRLPEKQRNQKIIEIKSQLAKINQQKEHENQIWDEILKASEAMEDMLLHQEIIYLRKLFPSEKFKSSATGLIQVENTVELEKHSVDFKMIPKMRRLKYLKRKKDKFPPLEIVRHDNELDQLRDKLNDHYSKIVTQHTISQGADALYKQCQFDIDKIKPEVKKEKNDNLSVTPFSQIDEMKKNVANFNKHISLYVEMLKLRKELNEQEKISSDSVPRPCGEWIPCGRFFTPYRTNARNQMRLIKEKMRVIEINYANQATIEVFSDKNSNDAGNQIPRNQLVR